MSHEEKYSFDYGRLEIDIHRNGRKYLTGFTLDPRLFIIDYLKTRYGKDFKAPRKVQSVSIDTGRHQIFCVDFLKVRSIERSSETLNAFLKTSCFRLLVKRQSF